MFDTTGFPPRWYCGTWPESLGWSTIASDVWIGIQYLIVALLVQLNYRKCGVGRGTANLATVFFILCGGDHLQFAMQFWWPTYPLSGYVWKPLEAIVVSLFLWFARRELPRWLTPRQLENKNAEIESLANAVSHPLYVVDSDETGKEGSCSVVNDQMLSLLGYSRESVVGQNMHQLIHHHDKEGRPAPQDQCGMFQAMRKGTQGSCEDDVIFDRDNCPIPVSWTSTPINTKEGVSSTKIEVLPHPDWDQNTHMLKREAQDRISLIESKAK